MIYKLKPESAQEIIAPDGEIVELPIPPNSLIKLNGPLMSINVSPSAKAIEQLHTHEKPIQTFNCNALIDTGASISVISPNVVEQLGLIAIGFQNVISVHNVEERPVYFGRLTFPWGGGMETSLVSCELQGMDCLIGRDILRFWYMVYDGVNGEITICD